MMPYHDTPQLSRLIFVYTITSPSILPAHDTNTMPMSMYDDSDFIFTQISLDRSLANYLMTVNHRSQKKRNTFFDFLPSLIIMTAGNCSEETARIARISTRQLIIKNLRALINTPFPRRITRRADLKRLAGVVRDFFSTIPRVNEANRPESV